MKLSSACYIAAACLFGMASIAELIEKREARATERITWQEATASQDGKVSATPESAKA